MAERLILLATALLFASGVPGLLLDRRSRAGQRIAAGLALFAAVIGLAGAFMAAAGATGRSAGHARIQGLPVEIALDPLAVVFLLPIFLMAGAIALYAEGYWPAERHPRSAARLRCFTGLTLGSMALVVLAGDALTFLCAWEAMALSAFFLVGTEGHLPEVRRAAWVYLWSTHFATLLLVAMFALLAAQTGSTSIAPLAPEALGPGASAAVFLLALVGFGTKAGLMPLHFWLPGAHASAPSHVSALLSGVLVKMGIYGLVRFTGVLPVQPASFGGLVLLAGVASAVLGVVCALGQHDLKRLLAYHTVENIGIIAIGLGLALLGRSAGRGDWVLLGLAGALLHVWNHALFKGLLFLCAGAVARAARERDLDRLGGLARRMPVTAACFALGAAAISGLPPLNGLASELLVYLGLFRTLLPGAAPGFPAAALAVPALAMVGALALACFVKAFGAAFLGEPRTGAAARAREAPAAMLLPMLALAGGCVLLGLAPFLAAPLLARAAEAWAPGAASSAELLAPLEWIGALGLALVAAVAFAALALRPRLRPVASAPGTWDCGYARPTSRMQYTSSSFAQMLASLFRFALRPVHARPAVRGLFPARSRFASHVGDSVLDGAILPVARAAARRMSAARWIHQGRSQQYLLLLLIALLLLLLSGLPLREWALRLISR